VVARHFNGRSGESVVKLHMPFVDNTCDAGGWRSRLYILRGNACLLRKHASVCKKCRVGCSNDAGGCRTAALSHL
jgi:hypothetical protein